MKKNILSAIRTMAVGTMVCLGVASTMLASCSSSDDGDNGLPSVNEYLPGKEWKIGSSTYSFFKNHMLLTETSAGVASGGLSGQAYMFFGSWSLNGDKLSTSFTASTQRNFDSSGLFQTNLSGVHTENDPSGASLSGGGGSLTVTEPRPLIKGTDTSNNKAYCLYYVKKMYDLTDDTNHDGALQGTWYASIRVTSQDGTAHVSQGKMTCNADGTVHFVIGSDKNFTTTYSTKNGKVTIDGYLVESNKHTFYYLNTTGVILQLFDTDHTYYAPEKWSKNEN